MLENNLDPEVAENARRADRLRRDRQGGAQLASVRGDRPCADALDDEETLIVQSGKPVGLFDDPRAAPRVLIANANLVPHGPPGRSSASSSRGADDVRADDCRLLDLHRQPGNPSGDVRDVRRGRARKPSADRCAGGSCDRRSRRDGRRAAARGHDERRRRAVIEVDLRTRSSAGSQTRYLGRASRRLDDALARLEARRVGGTARSRLGCSATPPTCCPELVRRDVHARHRHRSDDAHDPLEGYVPVGMTVEQADGSARGTPTSYLRRVGGARSSTCRDAGARPPRRRGLRLRQRAARAGAAARRRGRVRVSRLRARVHPAALLRGQGPVPVGGALRRPRGHLRTDEAILDLFGDQEPSRRWIRSRARRCSSRACPPGSAGSGTASAKLGLRVQRDGRVAAAAGADRDRPRPPRLRARWHRPSARPRRCATAPTRSPIGRSSTRLLNTAWARSWVSVHHGGGVGMG